MSVKLYLTSGASVCPEITVTDSASNEGQNIVGFSLKLLCSRATALPVLYGYCGVGHFISAEHVRELAIIRAIPTALVAQAHEYMQCFAKKMAFQLYRETATADPAVV